MRSAAGGSRLWRAVRWRAGISALTVGVASIAVVAAVVGPLYLRAAGDSVTRTTLRAAPVQASGVTIDEDPGVAADGRAVTAGEAALAGAAGPRRYFGPPLTTYLLGGTVHDAAQSAYATDIEARTGLCAHLRFTVGGCPSTPGHVAVSTRTARQVGIRDGETLAVSVHGDGVLHERVVGVYGVPGGLGSSYWWGDGPGTFPFGTTVAAGPEKGLVNVDPLVTVPATVLAAPAAAAPFVEGQVPLLAGAVHVGTVGPLLRSLDVARSALQDMHLAAATPVVGLLAAVSHSEHLMTVIVVVVAAQLLLLALWILASLIAQGSEARVGEVRLARLCGFPPRSVLAVAAAEPALLCLVGLPVGLALAWAVTLGMKALVLDPATSVGVDGLVGLAALAAVVGTAAAVALGSARMLRRPILDDRAVAQGGRWRARAGRTADLAVLALAGAGLVELDTTGVLAGGHTDPVASVAPALISVAVGILGVRLLLAAGGLVVRGTRWSGHVVTFLVVRELTRRPVLLRQVRVLVVAIGLASFATATYLVTRANDRNVADFAVGAEDVVTVQPASGVDPVTAVRELDPSGRRAMAVAVVATSSSTLLAVDAGRLAAVAHWSRGVASAPVRALAAAIDPPVAPEVDLHATELRVTTDTGAGVAPGDRLEAYVFDETYDDPGLIDLGPLRPGRQVLEADVSGYCTDRCRLDGVGIAPAHPYSQTAQRPAPFALTVTGVAQRDGPAWQAVGADLGVAQGWRGPPDGGVGAARVAGGYRFELSTAALAAAAGGLTATSPPLAAPADVPANLPGVVTDQDAALNNTGESGGLLPSEGIDGGTVSVRQAAAATALPGVGTDATLVDLPLLQREQQAATSGYTTWQVWLAPGASGLIPRLRAVGLPVSAVTRAATARAALDASGPTLAIDFFVAAAGLGVLLAAAGTLAGLSAAARRRAAELAVTAAAGVPRRVLTRALRAEAGVLAAGCVLGALGGIVAAALALPSVPELASVPPAPPLEFGLPLGPLALLVVAAVVVTTGAGVAAVALTIRRSVAGLLRLNAE